MTRTTPLPWYKRVWQPSKTVDKEGFHPSKPRFNSCPSCPTNVLSDTISKNLTKSIESTTMQSNEEKTSQQILEPSMKMTTNLEMMNLMNHEEVERNVRLARMRTPTMYREHEMIGSTKMVKKHRRRGCQTNSFSLGSNQQTLPTPLIHTSDSHLT